MGICEVDLPSAPSRALLGDGEMRGAAQNQVGDAETIASVESASIVALRDAPNHANAIAVIAANERCRSHCACPKPMSRCLD
jgi:hypothetical protein